MKSGFWYKIVAILGFTAVALGAFGAHGLKPVLSVDQYANFQTGVMYQFVHTLAILSVATTIKVSNPKLVWCVRCWSLGVLLFSGSLYLLATRDLLPFGSMKWLGPVTPVGGILFLAGWLLLGLHKYKSE